MVSLTFYHSASALFTRRAGNSYRSMQQFGFCRDPGGITAYRPRNQTETERAKTGAPAVMAGASVIGELVPRDG